MPTDKLLLLIDAFIFGLIFGSFLNVLIYRIPKKMAPLGRSFCPLCKTPIPLYRNIPVLSYLLQGGKSACCHKPISLQYPIVELLTGGLAVLMLLTTGRLQATGALTIHPMVHFWLWFLLFICPLIVLSVIDLELFIIPDVITLPLIPVGVVVQLILNWPDWLTALKVAGVGIVGGGGTLLILAEVVSRIKKRDAMGGGDIKLAAVFGAFLGFKPLIFIFFASSVIALLGFVLIRIVRKGAAADQQIPFGPFLSLAAMLFLFYGKPITDWYFVRLGGRNPFFP